MERSEILAAMAALAMTTLACSRIICRYFLLHFGRFFSARTRDAATFAFAPCAVG